MGLGKRVTDAGGHIFEGGCDVRPRDAPDASSESSLSIGHGAVLAGCEFLWDMRAYTRTVAHSPGLRG